MQRKAFTLIELLVVIAIIAILAAILFPVFAQAKLAAKKTAALSGTKQLGLAVIMYDGDYDGQFPLGFEGSPNTCPDPHSWTGLDLWCQRVQPYTKSIGVFEASTDSEGGAKALPGTWAGVGISFAVNAYYGNWCCSPNWNSGFQLRGPMGVGNNKYACGNDEGNGWLMQSSLNESVMTQPSGTILAAEKNGSDIETWNTTYGAANGCGTYNCEGNMSGFAMGGTLGGTDLDVANAVKGWGPQQVPNAKTTAYQTAGNGNPLQYEYGINGAVSASYSGLSVFAYVDGHAKASIPSSTNPDPVNLPASNQWDGLR